MKITKKRVAYICIILNIVLLLQVCLGTVIAVEDTASEPEIVEEAVIAAHDGEIQAMAASGCGGGHVHGPECYSSTIAICRFDYSNGVQSTCIMGVTPCPGDGRHSGTWKVLNCKK